MDEQTAATPSVSIEGKAGYGVGLGVIGAVVLAVVVVTGDSLVEPLVPTLVMTVIFGVLMWFVSRKDAERRRPVLDRVTERARLRGFVGGLVQALLVAGAVGLILGLLVWVAGLDQSWEVLAGIMLGSGLWMALEIRDLRRTGAS